MHSCTKSYLIASHRLDISTCTLLKIFLIKVALQHVKRKTDAFKNDLKYPKLLADEMAICFLLFGLNYSSENLETQVKDVKLDESEEEDVCCPHATKRKN